jgi:hypothetical protein
MKARKHLNVPSERSYLTVDQAKRMFATVTL